MKETLTDWLGTFWKILILPTPETFRTESKKADGKFASAVGWLVFLAVYLYILIGVVLARVTLSIPTFLGLALAVPLAVILAASAMSFILQRVFERKGYLFDKVMYLGVSVLVPVFFVFASLSLFIPANIFVFITYIFLFYQVALLTIGIKVIADIEYWQAFVSVFLSSVVGLAAFVITLLLIRASITPPETITSINSSR